MPRLLIPKSLLRRRCLLLLLSCTTITTLALDVCKGEGPRYGDFKCNHDRTHRVCATLKDANGRKISWNNDNKNFWQLTNQPDWSRYVGADPRNPGGGWCICMWATASLIKSVGCDNVHLTCSSTDVKYVMQSYTDGGVDLAPAKACLKKKCGSVSSQTKVVVKTVQQFHSQYALIFRSGNRNAASHLWASYLIQRSSDMPRSLFVTLAAAYCPVSGSIVTPSQQKLYKVSLPYVRGGSLIDGFMYFCCWPCACDTKAHVKIDTKSIATSDGNHSYYVAVIGDPCKNPSFSTPHAAPELKCHSGKLVGATYSDHGHVILSLFFTASASYGVGASTAVVTAQQAQTATRIGQDVAASQLTQKCRARQDSGYQSGMAKIFIDVAKMTPVSIIAATQSNVTQSFVLSNVSIARYNADHHLKTAIEKGYGKVVGIVTCADNECEYKPGCGVLSHAVVARRSGVRIQLTAMAKGIPVHPVGASSLSAGIAAVVASDSRLKGTSVPSARTISRIGSGGVVVAHNSQENGPVTSTTPKGSGSDGNLLGALVAVVVSCVVLVGMIAAAVFMLQRRRQGIDDHDPSRDENCLPPAKTEWAQLDDASDLKSSTSTV